jgi:glycerol-3-phosphate acyltransferase PlsY
MTGLYEILGVPFGFLLRLIYDTVGIGNYAIAIVLAILAIWRHRANIQRLLNGTENKTDVRKIGKKS